MASTPLRRSCQNASGSLAPPGKRRPKPITAIGSRLVRSKASSRACVSCSARKARLSGDSSSPNPVLEFIDISPIVAIRSIHYGVGQGRTDAGDIPLTALQPLKYEKSDLLVRQGGELVSRSQRWRGGLTLGLSRDDGSLGRCGASKQQSLQVAGDGIAGRVIEDQSRRQLLVEPEARAQAIA